MGKVNKIGAIQSLRPWERMKRSVFSDIGLAFRAAIDSIFKKSTVLLFMRDSPKYTNQQKDKWELIPNDLQNIYENWRLIELVLSSNSRLFATSVVGICVLCVVWGGGVGVAVAVVARLMTRILVSFGAEVACQCVGCAVLRVKPLSFCLIPYKRDGLALTEQVKCYLMMPSNTTFWVLFVPPNTRCLVLFMSPNTDLRFCLCQETTNPGFSLCH